MIKKGLGSYLITFYNAYFQDDDFSNFTGIRQKPGEVFEALDTGRFAYLPMIVMLTTLDTLGSLLTDKRGIKNRMEVFLKELLPTYADFSDQLYNLRNTMVHDWEGGMKAQIYTGSNNNSHMKIVDDVFKINLGKFYKDLKFAVETLISKIETDPDFYAECTKRLDKKIGDSKKKL